jgi:hypothetical protein
VRPAVRRAFVSFTADLEGVVYSIYADIKGYLTTGIGNLIDSPDVAAALPFRHPNGRRATPDEIRAEWREIKAGCCLASGPGSTTCLWPGRRHPRTGRPCFQHCGWTASEKHAATLKLTPADVAALVDRVRDQKWSQLAGFFPEAESWPGDAQLGILSMAWALGAAFAPRFPRLEAALRERDFLLAAEECSIVTSNNPGVIPRNRRNRILFRNAHVVHKGGLDHEALHWPRDLFADAPTLPQLHDDDEDTQTTTVPAMRPPPSHERVHIVHPAVPMGRPVLDGDLPDPDDAA